MSNYNELLIQIKNYRENHRPQIKPDLEVGSLYDLFPDRENIIKQNVENKWDDPWPNGERQGVYIILSEALDLLYIGKASMKNILASRLSSYFGYQKDKRNCRIYGDWKIEPRYIMTIAVPSDSSFEAPSLEEFLLINLTTTENKIGRHL